MVRTKLSWGALSVAQFLAHFWQRKPLLLRGFVEPSAVNTELQMLRDHALGPTVPSRLIRHRGTGWSLAHGPFERLPSLKTPGWTVLLQGMDCVHPQAHALRCAFAFLPQARIDDVMVSVASHGGGVGAHADAYDVFLVQGRGRRRWRWGWQSEQKYREDTALRLLKHFDPQDEAILGPGDALYLPPRWCHEGTALEPCSTWSVGFRAPSRKEFLAHFLAEAADPVCGGDPRYTDPHPGDLGESARVPTRLQAQLERWALDYRPDRATLTRALGRFLTEPQPHAVFDAPTNDLELQDFAEELLTHGIALAPATRLLYNTRHAWINGECAGSPGVLLRRLADQGALDARDLRIAKPRPPGSALDPAANEMKCKQSVDFSPLIKRLYRWYASGWVVLGQLPWGRNL